MCPINRENASKIESQISGIFIFFLRHFGGANAGIVLLFSIQHFYVILISTEDVVCLFFFHATISPI